MANPIFIPAVFAQDGIKNTIEKELQVGQAPESLTWTKGAPLITMTAIDDGGKAPLGQDFNGALNAMCAHNVYGQNGNKYQWSQDVVNEYGGYAKGAIIQSDDTLREFQSLVDLNTSNPNLGLGSTWIIYSGQGSIPTATSTTAGITRVLNTLTSSDTGAALSAAQGSVLNGRTQQAQVNNVGISRFATLAEVLAKSSESITTRPSDIVVLIESMTLGINQNWVNVTGSRSLGGTYVNNTGKPIMVSFSAADRVGGSPEVTIIVGGVTILVNTYDSGENFGSFSHSFIVPRGATYTININITGVNWMWTELR